MTSAFSALGAIALIFLTSTSRVSTDSQTVQTPAQTVPTSDAKKDALPPDAKKDAEGKRDPQTSIAKPPARLVTLAADGTLSVTGSRASLQAVLNEISVQAKFAIVLADALERERVSVVLRDVPLEEGLKRLLAAYDAFYLYSAPDNKSPGLINAIWVYPRGEGRALEPVPPTLWASTKELEQQLDDPDPNVRSNTYEALIERRGDRALATVLRGLVDIDESVRLMTLTTALNTGIEIPASDLHAVVLSDQSQHVRMLALEALEGKSEAEAIAESVKDDSDELIRNQARLMLEALKTRGGRKPPLR
jgi:hypothetical protein